MQKKICNNCGQDKSLSDFYKQKDSADGYRSHCKECMKLSRKEYYKKNSDRIKEYQKEYRKKRKAD